MQRRRYYISWHFKKIAFGIFLGNVLLRYIFWFFGKCLVMIYEYTLILFHLFLCMSYTYVWSTTTTYHLTSVFFLCKMTKWESYTVQSHFAYLSYTFQLTEGHCFILWFSHEVLGPQFLFKQKIAMCPFDLNIEFNLKDNAVFMCLTRLITRQNDNHFNSVNVYLRANPWHSW